MLADLGAEVIKVERPGIGDDTRQWGPPYLTDEAGNDTAESAYFLSANRAGYDFMIQAMGGLMSITGEPDGAPGGGPEKVGVAVADVFAGLYSVIAIQAALAHRDRTGEGQHIDMALLDVQVATLANQGLNYLTSKTAPKRMGNAHPNIVPYQSFATQDGHLILAIGNDGQFSRFCGIAELKGLASDTRFSTNPARVANRELLIPLIGEAMLARTTDEWLSLLEPEHVPCGPINTIDRVFDDPQVRHRGMELQQKHPIAGVSPGVANPIKMSATPPVSESAAPTLGQHTDQVLGSLLSLDVADLQRLREDGAIG